MNNKVVVFPKKLLLLAAAVLVVILLFACMTIVPAGHTGVVTTFGAVSGTVLAEGLHFKLPFVNKIVVMDNRVQKTEVSATSASKDLQTVSSVIALNYRLNTADSANVYKNIGKSYVDVIVNPAIQECVKSVTARYTAEELITERQKVSQEMMSLLEDKITPYGLHLEIFNIISFDFSEEFNAAIEAKQTAQQEALKAEQDLARIRVEAEQTIAQAEAEAESYRLINDQITPEMLQMEWIKKWNGELPAVVSDGSGMLLDPSKLMDN